MKYLIESPLISVVMSAYNASITLKEAIDSILSQTFIDLEFLIVNDASTDDTEKIILSYLDERIVYLKNTENKGLVYSLNKAIKMAKGKYIARLDADDISCHNRLSLQYTFMEKHPEVDICGTWMYQFAENRFKRKVISPILDKDIKAFLLFKNPIFHPSVLMRKDIFDSISGYDSEDYRQEDLGLWINSVNAEKVFFNIPIPLIYYRYSPNSESNIGKNNLKCYSVIRTRIIGRLLNDLAINDETKSIISTLTSSVLIKECSLIFVKENIKKLFLLLGVVKGVNKVSLRRALAYHLLVIVSIRPAIIKHFSIFMQNAIWVDMVIMALYYSLLKFILGRLLVRFYL